MLFRHCDCTTVLRKYIAQTKNINCVDRNESDICYYLLNGVAYETHYLSCFLYTLLTGSMLSEHWPKKHIFVPMTHFVRTVYHCKHDAEDAIPWVFDTNAQWEWKECLLLLPAGFLSPPLFDVLCPWRKWTIPHCQRTLEPLHSAIGATTFIILTKGNKQLPQCLTAFSHLQILE